MDDSLLIEICGELTMAVINFIKENSDLGKTERGVQIKTQLDQLVVSLKNCVVPDKSVLLDQLSEWKMIVPKITVVETAFLHAYLVLDEFGKLQIADQSINSNPIQPPVKSNPIQSPINPNQPINLDQIPLIYPSAPPPNSPIEFPPKGNEYRETTFIEDFQALIAKSPGGLKEQLQGLYDLHFKNATVFPQQPMDLQQYPPPPYPGVSQIPSNPFHYNPFVGDASYHVPQYHPTKHDKRNHHHH